MLLIFCCNLWKGHHKNNYFLNYLSMCVFFIWFVRPFSNIFYVYTLRENLILWLVIVRTFQFTDNVHIPDAAGWYITVYIINRGSSWSVVLVTKHISLPPAIDSRLTRYFRPGLFNVSKMLAPKSLQGIHKQASIRAVC